MSMRSIGSQAAVTVGADIIVAKLKEWYRFHIINIATIISTSPISTVVMAFLAAAGAFSLPYQKPMSR